MLLENFMIKEHAYRIAERVLQINNKRLERDKKSEHQQKWTVNAIKIFDYVYTK